MYLAGKHTGHLSSEYNCKPNFAGQITEDVAVKLDKLCRSLEVKLLIVRSYGLVGYLRVSIPATSCMILEGLQIQEGCRWVIHVSQQV